jgi:hypothetical protein
MALALASFASGIIAYFVTLLVQSKAARRNLDSWGDTLFVSAIPAALLAVAWLFVYLGEGGGVSAVATTESMFESRRIVTLPILGFASVGFLIPVAIHVFVLKRNNSVGEHDV